MIRWQLLTCAIALTAAHLLEITINGDQPREPLGAHTLLDELRRLDAVRLWYPGRREPERQFETPPNTQQKARRAFGLQIDERGALQPASRMPFRLNSLRLPSTAIPLNSVGGVDCSGSP